MSTVMKKCLKRGEVRLVEAKKNLVEEEENKAVEKFKSFKTAKHCFCVVQNSPPSSFVVVTWYKKIYSSESAAYTWLLIPYTPFILLLLLLLLLLC